MICFWQPIFDIAELEWFKIVEPNLQCWSFVDGLIRNTRFPLPRKRPPETFTILTSSVLGSGRGCFRWEVHSSNPVISRIYIEHLFTFSCIKETKIKKKRPGIAHLNKQCQFWCKMCRPSLYFVYFVSLSNIWAPLTDMSLHFTKELQL